MMLYDLHTSKNSNFPYHYYEKFDLDLIDPAECKAEFRDTSLQCIGDSCNH